MTGDCEDTSKRSSSQTGTGMELRSTPGTERLLLFSFQKH